MDKTTTKFTTNIPIHSEITLSFLVTNLISTLFN